MAKPQAAAQVRIVSDGTYFGTSVLVDGKPMDSVIGVTWSIDHPDRLARAVVECDYVEVDVTGETEVDS